MFYIKLCAAVCLFVILYGCAPNIDKKTEADTLSAETRNLEVEGELESIFLEMHLTALQKISALKKSSANQALKFEIISIVNTAEEFYLKGDIIEAIELLNEADELLE
ncbi:MAG TPA: hypothetical protein VKO43_07265 [Candidatus Krumholzibacteriaceae bacterium]|nr:hypothetical protein [Candidatus Krumholzibacteriaceae bacterium]